MQSNRVFQLLSEDFKHRIRCGEWLPGEQLPSITSLAKELDVSAGSVREALRSLQSIGMVSIRHGRGVFVTDTRRSSDLVEHFQDVDIGLIVALAETRRILEPELAALAAERGTDEELVKIEGYARGMDMAAAVGGDFTEADVQFHYTIAQAARNPILYQMIADIGDLLLTSRKLTAQEPGMTTRSVRFHLLIADAICARDAAQARLLMLAHMNDSLNGVLAVEARMQQP